MSTSDHEITSTLKWKSSMMNATRHPHFAQRPRSHTLPTNPAPIAGQLEHLQKLGVAPFLKSLYTILSLEDPLIVGWTVDGRAFEVRDQDRLSHVILPKYFRHQKFSSFQRQLNYFGFKKLTKSHAHVCTYLREHFHRHSPRALILIKRKTHGTTRQRQLSLEDLESNCNTSPRALLESDYFYPTPISTGTSESVDPHASSSHPPTLHLPPTRFHPQAHAHPSINYPNLSAFGNYRNYAPQHLNHHVHHHATTNGVQAHPWDNQYWVLSTVSPDIASGTAIDQILYEGEDEPAIAKFANPLIPPSLSISSTKSSLCINSDDMTASDLVVLRDAVAMICDDDELLGSSPIFEPDECEMNKENAIQIKQEQPQNNPHPVRLVDEKEKTEGPVLVTN